MEQNRTKEGVIFNIQHFSVHDGPGIRTIVFLKGCPLRCRWCANPESQKVCCELAWSARKCINCAHCTQTLPEGIVSRSPDGMLSVRHNAAFSQQQISKVCPSGALHILGEHRSVGEIIDIVEKDAVFYANSEGGMTLSGGEPLIQSEFALALLREAQERHIHCAMETSGHVSWEVLESAGAFLDYVLYDIKSMDGERHRAQTGVSNELILKNFQKFCFKYPEIPILVRTPVVPGFNDRNEDISAILDFIEPFPNIHYELLPYHRLGEPKYTALGRTYPMGKATLDEAVMKELQSLTERRSQHA